MTEKNKKVCRVLNYLENFHAFVSTVSDCVLIFAFASLNTIKDLCSKALFDSYVNHGEFVSVNNLVRRYNGMKEEIKNPENAVEYTV